MAARCAITAIAKLMSKPQRLMDIIDEADNFLTAWKKNISFRGAFEASQDECALVCDPSSPASESGVL